MTLLSHARKDAEWIAHTLRLRGHTAYFAGGCVRDIILKREPADYDVATDATPDQVMRIFPAAIPVGAQFGVVLVAPAHDQQQADVTSSASRGRVEVATFRCDLSYSDGRHPDQVRFSSSPQEDAQRRDFTINGLLLDPASGEVLDFVGGRNDIQAGIIRAIGDPEQRFAEDKLRLLRAVRFAARFQFLIEAATFGAMQKHALRVRDVSHERTRVELTKMLTEGHARQAFLLLDSSGLLKEVLPEISAMKGVDQPPQYHPEGDVFEHTLLLLEQLSLGCSPTLAWGALLHDVGKPSTFRVAPDRIRFDGHVEVGVKMAENICRRLRFSNDDTQQSLALVQNHMRFGDVLRMKDSTLKKFLRLPAFEEHMALHRMDCLSSHRDLTCYHYAQEKLHSIPPETMRPVPLVTGDDLIRAGYKPGPQFKHILAAIEDAQLEGLLLSGEDAMDLVWRQFPLP